MWLSSAILTTIQIPSLFFTMAVARPWHLLLASFVLNITPSSTTLRTKAPQSSLMGNPHGPSSSRDSSHPRNQKSCASILTSKVNNAPNIPLNASMSALFAAPSPTTLSPSSAVPPKSKFECFLDAAHPPHLVYTDFSPFIIRRPLFNPRHHLFPEIFDRIIHPYDSNSFDTFLRKHNLSTSYPLLVSNLCHGFPLGPMPELSSTNIIPNHSSTCEHMHLIDDYLSEELSSGRMSGPFSKEDVERILHSPFQSSPFIIAFQPQAPGEPDKIRICCHLSKSTKNIASVNSFMTKSDFPTRFNTASRVAEIVSLFLYFLCPPPSGKGHLALAVFRCFSCSRTS